MWDALDNCADLTYTYYKIKIFMNIELCKTTQKTKSNKILFTNNNHEDYFTIVTMGYSVSGEDVLFWAVKLNFLRNLVISLFPILLTTAGGAQPPGLTEKKQTV